MIRRIDAICSQLWKAAQRAPRASAPTIALLVTGMAVGGVAALTNSNLQAPLRAARGEVQAAESPAAESPAAEQPAEQPVAVATQPVAADADAGEGNRDRATLVAARVASPVGGRGGAQPAGVATDESLLGALTPMSDAELAELPPKERLVSMIKQGAALLLKSRDFKAVLTKQERRRGELTDPEEIEVKIRRAPLSVYLKWSDPSPPHEILWQDGRDDGKLLYHDGGWKGRLTPMLKVDPGHRVVKAVSRRPLSKIGPWELARELAVRRKHLEQHPAVVTCEKGESPDGRACFKFTIRHPDPHPDLPCHCTVLFVDCEWKIPVGCELYDWPSESTPDEPVLLESYVYSQIEFDVGLTDADFDPANSAYGFRKLAKN